MKICNKKRCLCREPHLCSTSCQENHNCGFDDPWDNLKVNDILTLSNLDSAYPKQIFVQAVVGNLVATKKEGSRDINWVLLRVLKNDGWTIKDSTPKEEKENESYYYDLSDSEIIPCPDGRPGCLVLHYKPKTNKHIL